MKLEDLKVYILGMELGDSIWEIVNNWDYFAKNSLGNQLVRAADSIAANLSEGFGRFSYKENKRFCYYSRESLFETSTWLQKALNRNLISERDNAKLQKQLNDLGVRLNNYIRAIGNKPNNE